jgi:hypothetical protein
MRAFTRLQYFLSAFLLFGCTIVPPLEQATGTSESNILIADIVTRIKCEIADTFDHKLDDPVFLWMSDWTVKADLTLQANTQAGISPSGSYTKYRKNAFNFDAGSSSLTNNTIAAVNQFFTFGAGVNLAEQAVRTEVLSFSLSLLELKRWRQELRQIEMDPSFPTGRLICAEPGGIELKGGLGLKEWIDSALYPVETEDLQYGLHPNPTIASKPGAPGAVSPPKFAVLDIESAKKRVAAAVVAAANALNSLELSGKNVEDDGRKIKLAGTRIKMQPYYIILNKDLKNSISKIVTSSGLIVDGVKNRVRDAEGLLIKVRAIKERIDRLTQPDSETERDVTLAEYDALVIESYAKYALQEKAKTASVLGVLQKFNPDPPIDSLLHSVQFVVLYGASVSPSWTLLHWKGPSLSGPAASASGTRTHILNLALGPGSNKGSLEQARLLMNQTILSTFTHP